MSTLRLFLENKDKSWTLKPNREYIIGSSIDCQIPLPEEEIASQQLKLKFSQEDFFWYVYNLDNSQPLYINSLPFTEYKITEKIHIFIKDKPVFVVIPDEIKEYDLPSSNVISQVENPERRHTKSIFSAKDRDKNESEYPVKNRSINRNIFDKEDPEQLRGIWLRSFSFSFNHSPKAKNQSVLESVKEDLYKEIYKKLKKYQKDDFYLSNHLFLNLINYRDSQYYNDKERIYIEVTKRTIRNTNVSILMRFFVHGDDLYFAADSYALGKLSWIRLIFHSGLSLTIVLFTLIPIIVGMITTLSAQIASFWIGAYMLSFGSIPGLIALWYLYSTWIKFIRALSQRESFSNALRVNFPRNIQGNAFDLDDMQMFLKSIYPLMISSLQTSLEKHGLLDDDIMTVLKDIKNNISQTTINVNTGGGGIIGSIIGGINNAMNNQSQGKG